MDPFQGNIPQQFISVCLEQASDEETTERVLSRIQYSEETTTTTPPDQLSLEAPHSPFSLDNNPDVTADAEEKVRQMEAAQQIEKQSAMGQSALKTLNWGEPLDQRLCLRSLFGPVLLLSQTKIPRTSPAYPDVSPHLKLVTQRKPRFVS